MNFLALHKRRIILLGVYFSFIQLPVFSQESNILELKKKPHYTETNAFTSDSLLKLSNVVIYDLPHVSDVRYEHQLLITLKTNPSKKHFELPKDSSDIQCVHNLESVWVWARQDEKPSGTIDVLSWTPNKISLVFNLEMTMMRTGAKIKYIGKRNFKKFGK